MRQRIHRLDSVQTPETPPGTWRLAGPADRDLVVRWSEAFEVEAGLAANGRAGPAVDARLAEDRAFIWLDPEPVSYVGTAAPAGGAVRVGPVYTPPEHRGRGYARALVAAVSQRALDGGARMCCLYTDLANPTSNRIYFAVGYRPVCDVTMYEFSAPP